MSKTIKSFMKFLKSLRSNDSLNLSVNEKNGIKKSLIQEIDKNHVRKNPFLSFIDVFKNTFIPLTQNRMRILSFVAVFLVLFSGVSYAAEGALPGDALYSVKVAVNEEVRSLFNFSPEAELEWEKEKIERRVSELEELEEAGEVSDEAKVELAENLSEHVDSIGEILDEVERDADDGLSDAELAEMEDDVSHFFDEHSVVLEELLGDRGFGRDENEVEDEDLNEVEDEDLNEVEDEDVNEVEDEDVNEVEDEDVNEVEDEDDDGEDDVELEDSEGDELELDDSSDELDSEVEENDGEDD